MVSDIAHLRGHMDAPPTILFAGGGSGGHIYPGVAIAERLAELGTGSTHHFLISARPLDTEILDKHSLPYTALPVGPLPRGASALTKLPRFMRGWFQSVRQVRRLIEQTHVTAIVAMGGFVSGPAVVAGCKAAVPVALVNLDDPPGKANRWMAKRASRVFTVTEGLDGQPIGLPLRRSALGPADKTAARAQLGLDSDRPTLFITGGSQGAGSINQMMAEWLTMPQARQTLTRWQVLHLTGHGDSESLSRAYAQANVPAKVIPFCDQMGLAWSAATVAISRAGAGSVAEAWANATPTIFLPYPHHKDQHQAHNAQQLVGIEAALLCRDLVEPTANARQLSPLLLTLMNNAGRLQQMTQAMRTHRPRDGAQTIASWLIQLQTGSEHETHDSTPLIAQ